MLISLWWLCVSATLVLPFYLLLLDDTATFVGPITATTYNYHVQNNDVDDAHDNNN